MRRRALAEEAFVFGLPLVYIGGADRHEHKRSGPGSRAPLNQFAHFRALPDASDQIVVGLNVDTLYSLGSFDLTGGPLVLSVPEMGDRYWLMQLIDAWNSIPHVPGARALGGTGGDFGIVGPADRRSSATSRTSTKLRLSARIGAGRRRAARFSRVLTPHSSMRELTRSPCARRAARSRRSGLPRCARSRRSAEGATAPRASPRSPALPLRPGHSRSRARGRVQAESHPEATREARMPPARARVSRCRARSWLHRPRPGHPAWRGLRPCFEADREVTPQRPDAGRLAGRHARDRRSSVG